MKNNYFKLWWLAILLAATTGGFAPNSISTVTPRAILDSIENSGAGTACGFHAGFDPPWILLKTAALPNPFLIPYQSTNTAIYN